MEEYIGIIKLFAGNFAPRGYMLCNGQLLPISQYTALFSILGTYYGGNGTTSFALPDLRGRAGIGVGQGLGLSNITLGEAAGVENVTILSNNLPPHTHPLTGAVSLNVTRERANVTNPTGAYLAATDPNSVYNTTLSGGGTLNGLTNSLAVGPNTGGPVPIQNRDPYLGLTYIICVLGVFPSRN